MRATMHTPDDSRAARPDGGWTLIELLVVMTLIGVLASLALVQYRNSIQAAKEAVPTFSTTPTGNFNCT